MDPDEYESLPPSTPLAIVALAGSVAGIAEHCVMFPFDSVKTRMQSLGCEKQRGMSISSVFRTMITEEGGLLRPVRGISAMMTGAGPAHALYFTSIEHTKEVLKRNTNLPVHVTGGLSAVIGTALHDGVMTPAEVVKQRIQMCCSPYENSRTAFFDIISKEGVKALYRSYLTQLTMNIPFQTVVVSSYSTIQHKFNSDSSYSPSTHFVAGAISGCLACLITMPFDVCKTLLNTQESAVLKALNLNKLSGLRNTAVAILKIRGFSGFFQGLSARLIYQAPSTAIAWSVYEFFKHYLHKKNQFGSSSSIGSGSSVVSSSTSSTVSSSVRLLASSNSDQ